MPALALAAAATAASALYQGYQAKQQGDSQNAQNKADATATESNGMLKAALIRKKGLEAKSSAVAAAAQNGLVVDAGTPAVINDQIAANVENDAWMSILDSNNAATRLRADGKAAAKAGRNAMVASVFNAAGSMNKASGGMSGGSGGGSALSSSGSVTPGSLNINSSGWLSAAGA